MSATNAKTFSIVRLVTKEEQPDYLNIIEKLTDHVTLINASIPIEIEGQDYPGITNVDVLLPNGNFIDQEIHIRLPQIRNVSTRLNVFSEDSYLDGGVITAYDVIPVMTGGWASVFTMSHSPSGRDAEAILRWTGKAWLVLTTAVMNEPFTGGTRLAYNPM